MLKACLRSATLSQEEPHWAAQKTGFERQQESGSTVGATARRNSRKTAPSRSLTRPAAMASNRFASATMHGSRSAFGSSTIHERAQ